LISNSAGSSDRLLVAWDDEDLEHSAFQFSQSRTKRHSDGSSDMTVLVTGGAGYIGSRQQICNNIVAGG
jgi:hypothetical protein